MAEQTYFKFYFDWMDFFEELTTEEVGQIMLAAAVYAQTGEDAHFEDRGLRMAWKSIKGTIDRTTAQTENNRENGKKGGAPKNNRNAQKTTENNQKQPKTTENNRKQPKTTENKHTNTNTNTNANANTNTNTNTEAEEDTRACARAASASSAPSGVIELYPENLQEILDLWNSQNVTLNMQRFTMMSSRAANTRLCFQYVDSYEDFLNVIRILDEQAFFAKNALAGKKLSYDWFCKPDNFLKIVEGNYAEARGPDGSVYHEGWVQV